MKNRIKQLRIENGMSQEELSRKINVSGATVSRYESGDLDINTDALSVLSGIFDVSVDYILGNNDKRNHEKTTLADGYYEVIQHAHRKNISPKQLMKLIRVLDVDSD